MKEKLPTMTINQSVGNRAASELQAVMQKFSVFQEIDTGQDLGIDFIGTIIENCHPTKYNFNAQCKGTDDSEIIYLFNKDANYKLLETKERCYFLVFGRYKKRTYILDCTSQRS